MEWAVSLALRASLTIVIRGFPSSPTLKSTEREARNLRTIGMIFRTITSSTEKAREPGGSPARFSLQLPQDLHCSEKGQDLHLQLWRGANDPAWMPRSMFSAVA